MPFLPSEREPNACKDIIVNAEAALQVVAGMTSATFESDQRTDGAVVRGLEIIPEASRHLGPDRQARHPEIPWRDIADVGNFDRHADQRVALDIVWKTVHDPLTSIIAVCRAELSRPPAP